MKRAIFTLFQPQRWVSNLGQSTLMVLFVWCCLGISSALAQDAVKMPFDKDGDSKATYKFTACGDDSPQVGFSDDGSVDGNYDDSRARIDTVVICPTDQWSRVKVQFVNTFDLELNDSLVVFDGDMDAVNADREGTKIGSGSGVGVSQMLGGWVTSSCDIIANPTGCLTFILYTDGNQTKGSGWDAWATCESRAATFGDVNITIPQLECDEFTADVTIPAPSVELCGAAATAGQDVVKATVTNQKGEVCLMGNISNVGGTNLMGTFGIGIYKVDYELIADDTKKTSTTFSVQSPSLVCNDDIEVPFGSSCQVQLTPDDILENPCPPVADTLRYSITISFGSGKNAKTLTTDHSGATPVYPVITPADLAAAGISVCGGTAKVAITREYYYGLSEAELATFCNNGPQNATCETNLTFNDQSVPFISVPAGIDTLVACDPASVEGALPDVSAIDNCDSDVPVTYSVSIQESDPCFANSGSRDTTTATVTWYATDDCGNTGTFSKDFTIIRPNEVAKVEDEVRGCNDDDTSSSLPGLKVGSIKNGVFTVTDTVDLDTTDYICGYILIKDDIEIPSTDCGRKIYRYWSVINWCDASTGPSPVDTTFIEYTDTDAPVFQGEEEDQVIAPTDLELGPFDCTYDITKHPKPVATDDCDDEVDVNLHRVFRIEDGENWPVPASQWASLDCDSFRLMYIADDQCHEQLINDTTRQIVVIKDVTKPSAICTDQLNVSIASDEGARIHWSDIDAGSYDACGIESIEIRKKDSGDDWSEYVTIGCTDVHGDLRIEMRVTDKKGNENICWMSVTAEDKIPPVCGDLDDLSFYCDDFTTGELGAATGGGFVELTGDLLALYNDKFGDPASVCSDNLSCAGLTIKQYYKLTEGSCGALEIERKWKAEDWLPSTSNNGFQNITVSYRADWKLTFPADVDLSCGADFPTAASVADIVNNGTCDLWALEITEKTFDVPGDICMQVQRTYELINWCVYEPGTPATPIQNNPAGTMVSSEDYASVGRFTYVQILSLDDADAPTITVNPVETCIYGVGDEAPFGMADNSPDVAPYECDTVKTFSASATNCAGLELSSASFTWKFYVNGALAASGTGNSFSQAVSPKNKYKAQFIVSDGCGNSTSEDLEVEFWDCKKPTPYVLHGLAVELMQNGSVAVWAKDLDQGSYDNCTPKDKLQIKIYHEKLGDAPTTLEGVQNLPDQITFGCDDLTFGTQAVSIYVIDEEGNWDFVSTYVSVQDNMNACQPNNDDMGAVGGKITNPIGESVELVDVSVNGGENTMSTGATGTYEFSLPLEGDYTITPEKNINHLNGVSTYDLVLISKHILGIQTFDSPYKYIAADVNKSGSITAFDMVQLRQLILNITSEFPNNSSWRFVDAKYDFSTATNPAAEDFNEFMTINNLDGQMMDVDFVATKIGDVNGNATSNSLLGAESRTTNGTLNLIANDRLVEAGETVTVDFVAANIATTQGYQFTLDFTGLNLVELTEGVAKTANFNTNLADRGVLTTSWNGEATADEVLFSLTLTANSNGMLSEMIAISSAITSAEAYNTDGELLNVNLAFNTASAANFELSQNNPNPFKDETVVGFNLPEAGKATLTVMDVQGKVLTVIERDADKGYNQISVNAKSLGATGVLYYQLESVDNIATKKMIILE